MSLQGDIMPTGSFHAHLYMYSEVGHGEQVSRWTRIKNIKTRKMKIKLEYRCSGERMNV